MLDFLLTLLLFTLTVFLVPFILVGFIVLKIIQTLWLMVASYLHPDIEFVKYVTVRSLLDTHRNQGIISVLLCVKGQANPQAVRRHLQEVVRRRDKIGNLTFPRLRNTLVTKCGTYAWKKDKFDLDQNFTVAPFTFKGRAVTEYNIQEYVSDIVSKYLPASISPWHVIIIPTSENNHYILIKLHHMLLSEGLNIGDLLPLIPPTRQVTGSSTSKSPLVEVFKKPIVIPLLKERLTEEFSNRWNEFVANHDPLERPELLKSTPTFPNFMAICLITLISLIKECKKGFRVIKNDAFSKIKYIFKAAIRETDKRQISFENFIISIIKSSDPRNICRTVFNSVCYLIFRFPLDLIILIYGETRAFFTCLTLGYNPYPNTFVGLSYTYIPLIYNSMKEIFYIFFILFSAPKTIIQETLLQKESLQTITLCGRKSVAWSDPVRVETLRKVARQTGVSETEVLLSAISTCFLNYFTHTSHEILRDLPITIRHISSNYIFSTGPNIKSENAVSGILCLNMPIPNSEKEASHLENLVEIKKSFNSSLKTQGISHLLTMLQTKFGILTMFLPSTIVSIYLKYLSKKYAVSITEITSKYPNVTQSTIWGEEVNSVIYWRPPQANTSISLCLNEYADHVKLGVMCDTQLVPNHLFLVRNFSGYIHDLEKAVSVQ